MHERKKEGGKENFKRKYIFSICIIYIQQYVHICNANMCMTKLFRTSKKEKLQTNQAVYMHSGNG